MSAGEDDDGKVVKFEPKGTYSKISGEDAEGKVVFEVEEATFFLTCSQCKVMSFQVRLCLPSSGEPFHVIACAGCDREMNDDLIDAGAFRWAVELPDVPEDGDTQPVLKGYSSVVATGSAEVARRRTVKNLIQWSSNNELKVIVGYNANGSGSSWFDFQTEVEKEWVVGKLEALIDTIKGHSIKSKE